MVEDEKKRPFNPSSGDASIPIPKASPRSTPRREFYYTSARSLAGSGTPPFRTYMRERVAKSGPSAMVIDSDSSSDDEAGTRSAKVVASLPRQIPRSAAYGAFFATSATLPLQSKGLTVTYAALTGRRMLQMKNGSEHNALGQWLGWLMAAIYMGGRLPQIWLNVKRGSVEGLNPLMFIFALVANATYVLSIVVRTTEWGSLKANLPWLLDAVVCVALDLFIIMQYVYYKWFGKNAGADGEYYGDYMEASKEPDAS